MMTRRQFKVRAVSVGWLAAALGMALQFAGPVSGASPASVDAAATDVEFQLTQRQTAVGVPALMTITVQDGTDIGDPIPPEVDGVTFELAPGRSTSRQIEFTNGRGSSRSTTQMTMLITPEREGTFKIPPISITVDGRVYSSDASTITTVASTATSLLKVEVTSPAKSAWLGETVPVVLRILVSPYRSPEHGVVMSEGDMWQFIDLERSDLGMFRSAFVELNERGRRPQGHEVLEGNESYIAYELQASYTPASAGKPDFGDVRIAWSYPTRIVESRSFFGGTELKVAGTRPISAAISKVDLEVLALPTEHRPASFTGAVGEFTISATAKPAKVAVGDPITLTMTVTDRSGGPALEQVQPPLLDTTAITSDFRMPSAPLAGTISGNTKSFTQSLRPVRAGIDSIPPIEFSWFDPTTASYKSASSAAIPIEVVPSERVSTDAILGTATTGSAPGRPLTATRGGLLANAAPTSDMVQDRRSGLGAIPTAAILLAPPIACAAVMMLKRRKDRLGADPMLARANSARSRALERVAQGDGAGAISGYIADKVGRPSGTVTRDEAREMLACAGASSDLAHLAERILSHAERSRFSAGGGNESQAGQAQSARDCIGELERLNWALLRQARREGMSQ